MNIGAALKAVMLAKKTSVDYLAKITGLSRPAIYAVMEGKTKPLYSTVKRLAKALDVEMAEIVNLEQQISERKEQPR